LIIIINASDPQISEGSCDTKDWSNDAENHRNKLHSNRYSGINYILIDIHIENSYLNTNNILLFLLYF